MRRLAAAVLLTVGGSSAAGAQRTAENAVKAAQDAFGVSVGNERIGLYSDRQVRGFSPVTAGNVRLEGIYLDLQGMLSSRLVAGNSIRVGLTALGYPFAAPTGIVDYRLRDPSKPGVSAFIQIGPFSGGALELDSRIKATDTLTVAAGASLRRMENAPGKANRLFNLGLAPRWAPSSGFELRPFWAIGRSREDVDPTIFVAGFYLPQQRSEESIGQRWADRERLQITYGTLVKASLTDWLSLQAGVFRSQLKRSKDYSDLFRNTSVTGLADHVIIASSDQEQASTSGEARLIAQAAEGERTHKLHLMARGRRATSFYGGSASAAFGKALISSFQPVAKPDFAFGPRSRDSVSQRTGGIAYEGRWAKVGEIGLGLQKTAYQKTVRAPGEAPNSIASRPWLYNGTAAAYLGSRLVAYAALTRGLEENGTAPDVAANRGEPLPAAITDQREIGLRFALRPNFRFVASAFELKKPYFNLNSGNIFGALGSLRNRGVELSLSGPLAKGLNVVAGAAVMDPQVTGEAVALGRVGKRPVSQIRTLAKLNADYSLPFWEGASVDGEIEYNGKIAASARADPATGEQLNLPARTAMNVGGRYRFKLMGTPAAFRVELQNATNARGWRVTPAGGFQAQDPRRVQAQLTADF